MDDKPKTLGEILGAKEANDLLRSNQEKILSLATRYGYSSQYRVTPEMRFMVIVDMWSARLINDPYGWHERCMRAVNPFNMFGVKDDLDL